jgi:hypothetical protein
LTTLSVYRVKVAPSTPSTLYASTLDGLFRSLDGGSSWTIVNPNANADVRAVDPTTSSIVYSYLGRSTDGGATWAVIPGFPLVGLAAVAIDPTAPSTVYAATVGAGALQVTIRETPPCIEQPCDRLLQPSEKTDLPTRVLPPRS